MFSTRRTYGIDENRIGENGWHSVLFTDQILTAESRHRRDFEEINRENHVGFDGFDVCIAFRYRYAHLCSKIRRENRSFRSRLDLQNIGGGHGKFSVREESSFRSSTGAEVFLQKNFSLETHRYFHRSDIRKKLQRRSTSREAKIR